MNKSIPSALLAASVLSLSACTMGQNTVPSTPTATPVANLQQQLATPAPRAEPAFRTTLALKADKATLKVGEKAKVTASLAGLQKNATTFSTTFTVPDTLRIVSITANAKTLPLVFKSAVSSDGRSASIAASNTDGFGDSAAIVEIVVEGAKVGAGRVGLDDNDTSVLLQDNADVAPAGTLPGLEITVR